MPNKKKRVCGCVCVFIVCVCVCVFIKKKLGSKKWSELKIEKTGKVADKENRR